MKFPFVSRKDLDETVAFYDQWIKDDQKEIAELKARVEYLEKEREERRLASLARKPEPITNLPFVIDLDLERWEGEGGAVIDDGNGK
jgi:hypothetical protein